MAGTLSQDFRQYRHTWSVSEIRKGPKAFFRLGPGERAARSGCFAVRRGDIKERADVGYAADLEMIRQRYANPRYNLVSLGSLTEVVQYGTSKRSTSECIGVPVLRIPNLQVDGWDLSDLKYLELPPGELLVYRLEKGDILFNRTNGSRELVGKCEVFDFDGDWVFASYLIRLRIDSSQAIPGFITAFLNSFWGRRQVEHVSRQILMSNINAEEIRALRVPLPLKEKQRELLKVLNDVRVAQRSMITQGEELLSGLGAFVLDELGLSVPKPDQNTGYAIRLSDARIRFDPDYNSPKFRQLRARIESGFHPARSVGSLFNPIVSGFAAGANDQTDDPRLGVPHIRPLNITNTAELQIANTKMVPRTSVAEGDFLKSGEILFNNTNSTTWVGKTVVFNLDEDCACSNHITRLALIDKKHNPRFFSALFNALQGVGLFGMLATNFNNQAGVNVETLRALRVPVPSPEKQAEIAKEVSRRRKEAQRLREEANIIWASAKQRFEDELLGTDPATEIAGNAAGLRGIKL